MGFNLNIQSKDDFRTMDPLPSSVEELNEHIREIKEKIRFELYGAGDESENFLYLMFGNRNLKLSKSPLNEQYFNPASSQIVLTFEKLDLNLKQYNPKYGEEPFLANNQEHLQRILDILALELL